MAYRTHRPHGYSCSAHRTVAAATSCVGCAALLCAQCPVGGRCTKCQRRNARRRLAAGIAIVACFVATAGAAIASARSAPPPGAITRARAIADARAFAEAHPCDSDRLGAVLAPNRELMAWATTGLTDLDETVRIEVLRVHLGATCPPMSTPFYSRAFDVAMRAGDFTMARTLVDRELQGAPSWGAYEDLEQLGMATQDARLVRLAREGFQSIHPTATYGAAVAGHL